jgi:hypothetical protein
LFVLGDVRQKLRWTVLALLCLLGAAAVVGWFRPETFGTLGKFADTLRFWEEGRVSSSHSTMVRVYEYKNIHAQLAAHGNSVLGDGPGAVFTDEYHPFPFGLEEYDYTVDEILARRFQNPHGLIPNLMLNTGYIGMAAFLIAMAVLYAACFMSFRATADPGLKNVLLALLAFLPAMVYNAWSPKTYMLLGILLGIAGALAARVRDIDLPGNASLD